MSVIYGTDDKSTPRSFVIWLSGATYYMRNCATGQVTGHGTVDAAIQAGIALGGKHFYVRKAMIWIPTGNLVPAGIVVEGEDIDSTEIRTATPASDILQIGAKSMIANLLVTDASTNGKSAGQSARVHYFINGRSTTSVNFSAYPDQSILVYTGESGVDRPAIGVENYGNGDNYWAGVVGITSGIGFNCFVNQNQPLGTGKGVRVKIWSAGHGGVFEGGSGATGNLITLQNDAGCGDVKFLYINPSVNLTDVVALSSGALTSARMINLYQGVSAFSGYGLYMNFGAGGGSFTGDYIRLLLNTLVRFTVDYQGLVTARKFYAPSVATETDPLLLLQPNVNLADVLTITGSSMTSGNHINLYASGQSYTGYGIIMNFGTGGSFTGQFIRCLKAGAARFVVYGDGAVYSYDGLATKVKAGTVGDGDFTTVQDGKLAIDSTNGRLYFRYGAGWHYCAQDAGFQINADETVCPACGKPMEPGQEVKQIIDSKMSDGALHGHYEHRRCPMAKRRGKE